MKIVGKVLWWDARDKEGVILDPSGSEIYFNEFVLTEQPKTKSIEGRFVTYTINKSVTHMACAAQVSVVPLNSQSKARKSFEKNIKSHDPEVSAA